MKIALLGDTHLGARGDSLVFQAYFEKFYQDIFFPTLEKLNIKQVVHVGDFFDRRKFVNFAILNRVRMNILHPLEDRGIKMDLITGNHDCPWKNTNSVNSPQELLGGWSNIRVFHDPAEVVYEDGTKILLLPWITQENQDISMKYIRESDAELLCGHLELNGFQMYRGSVCDTGLDRSLFHRFPMVVSGHFHHKSSDGNINYLGAPYQITFSDLNDPRGFHVYDTETKTLTYHENPYILFNKIYYEDRGKTFDSILKSLPALESFEGTYVKVIVVSKTNPYYFEKFLEKLYKVNPIQVQTVEDYGVDNSLTEEENIEIAEDTLSLLCQYVDQFETDLDKERLKDIFKGVYVEANQRNLEI